MGLEFRHLETVYWVHRLGSYAAAARRLHTTQPNISTRIAEVEKRLARAVFAEGSRRTQLTPKGRELVNYAEEILSLRAEMTESMAIAGQLGGRVRVGSTETVAIWWLVDFVGFAHSQLPDVALDLDVDVAQNVWAKLHNGTVDVALVPGDRSEQRVVTRPLGSVAFRWMSRPGLFTGRGATSKDIAAEPVVSLASGARLYAEMFRWFDEQGVRPNRVVHCNTMSVVASLVRDGLGVSLLPPDLFGGNGKADALELVDVDQPLVELPFVAAYLAPALSPEARAVADLAARCSAFPAGLPATGRASRACGEAESMP